ncbi:MAG TPA: saccharopine dehydrogenase NADP-binding domain-containing protein [Rhizomicrobium sp.]|nr:saccharopine dehydrogenase NADP-binding domain-containing protein [Rhizomicrobium sp.]
MSSYATGEKAVAVFGASGHTGRFVVEELLRRGYRPIAVGRDSAKLASFASRRIDTRTASIDDASALDKAFAGTAAVINCAGPFLDTADAVASAAIRAGAHYLDVTAEQASAQATLEKFDKLARAAGVVVMPAMGFYGGFADLLATAVTEGWDTVDDIAIGIALNYWHPTEGTRLTGKRNTAPRVIVANGRLTEMPRPAAESSWDFASPFGHQDVVEVPLSEIVLIARHLRTRELHTYLNTAPLRDLGNPETPPPNAGASTQIFEVDVIARSGDETRRITAKGTDIYALTAPLVCEALHQILGAGAKSNGSRVPGELLDEKAFLNSLSAQRMFQICGVIIGGLNSWASASNRTARLID